MNRSCRLEKKKLALYPVIWIEDLFENIFFNYVKKTNLISIIKDYSLVYTRIW